MELVSKLSRVSGVDLPPSYQSFLLEHNGGSDPRDSDMPVPNCPISSEIRIRFFYGIENGIEYANILTTRSEGYFWGHLPSSVIPIANDSWGGMVVMDLCSGVVAVMYPAREEWDDATDSPTRYILANSFEDFLDNLRPPT